MAVPALSDDEAARLADMFRLLGDPSRLRILLACLVRPTAVGAIAEGTGLSISLVSHHLRLLRAARLVRATRVKETMDLGAKRPQKVQDYVGWGAGPRASEYLVLGAKAAALLAGATHVTPAHVKAVAHPVLRHRIMMNFNAEADQVTPDNVVDDLLAGVPVEGLTPPEKKKMDEVMR